MPSLHLVGHDPEALTCNGALELRGKETVILAQEDPSRHLRPCREGPGLAEDSVRLAPNVVCGLGCHVGRDVVQKYRHGIERVGEHVAGVGPPFSRRLTRSGHHRVDEDEERDWQSFAHQRGGETGQRLCDEDQLGSAPDSPDHRVCVVPQTGRVVFAGQVNCHDVVATRPKLGNDEMPVPLVGAGAVDQHVGCHAQ